MFKNLEDLIKTIRDRKNSSPNKSYTNKLLNDKNLAFDLSNKSRDFIDKPGTLKLKSEIKKLFIN